MSTDKIILKTILNTLLSILILIVFMLGMLIAFFPSTMMGITYSFGMDGASIYFAERSYNNSGDIYFISYATEVAIGSDDYVKIESCGERFIDDSGFDAYCTARNQEIGNVGGTYEQYVYVNVCLAKYETIGGVKAAESAIAWTEGFAPNNPMAAVLFTALEKGDAATISILRAEMEARQAALSAADAEYFNGVYSLLNVDA